MKITETKSERTFTLELTELELRAISRALGAASHSNDLYRDITLALTNK